MKTLKKILSFILVVTMVIATIPITATAAQPMLTIIVNNTEPNIGDTIVVDVYISENSNIGVLTVDLCYDSSTFDAVSMISYGIFKSNGKIYEECNHALNGRARFTGVVANVVTEGGKLFTVELKVLKNAQSELSLVIDEAVDNDYKDVSVLTNKVVIKSTNLKGDVNCDGKISAIDARLLMQYICGLRELSNSELIRADISRDNNVSVIDALIIFRFVAGLTNIDTNYKPGNTPIKSPVIMLKTNSKDIDNGDFITVTVELLENPGLSGITADICFNSKTYKVVSMTDSSGIGVVNKDFDEGKARFCTTTSNYSIDSGTICTIQLEVLDTENTNISLDIIDAIDDDYDSVSVIANDIVFCSEHSYTEWEVIEEANCYTYGCETRSCINCGHQETQEIPLTSCKYVEKNIVSPTCLYKGYTTYTCIYCGQCYDDNYVDATGHNYTWYTISIASCEIDGVKLGECSVCGDIGLDATPKLGHDFANGICMNCGCNESGNGNGGNTGDDENKPDEPEIVDYEFNIKTPSITSISHKDGIILYAEINGNAPDGSYVKWTNSNNNFKTSVQDNGNNLKIISDSNGKTTFTATLYSEDGEILASDSIEMKSKAGFFDKIGSFFRSIFGMTKIYDK